MRRGVESAGVRREGVGSGGVGREDVESERWGVKARMK